MRTTSPSSRPATSRRPPTAIRRLLGAVAGSLLLAGGLVAATAGPAAADPPELTLVNRCGAVEFSWDTGTIGGDERWPTTVLRNGTVIDEFAMGSRGDATYGALDGDSFEIRREGLPERGFAHEAPDGCAGVPALTVTAADECFSLRLTFANAADTPATGLQVLVPGDAPREVDPVGFGSLDLHLGLRTGDPFQVRGPVPGGGWATWLTGRYNQPARCTPDAVQVRFTDVCDGVRVDLASTAGGVIRVEAVVSAGTGGGAVLPPGGTGRIDVAAVPGTTVVVRDAVAGAELATHTIGSPACGSAEPTEPPVGTAPPTGPGAGPGAGGGLPVTGASAVAVSVAGVLLVGAGAVLFGLARRRRLRFTTVEGR
jgi:LPXTG-motif cell wall-anchored protein